MQQYLPFTVLKLMLVQKMTVILVATVLTVYGIETHKKLLTGNPFDFELQQYLPFTVLKREIDSSKMDLIAGLQQYLPFTVLKQGILQEGDEVNRKLQQYLPFTVLKHNITVIFFV